MAHYLIKAKPKDGVLGNLEKSLKQNLFFDIKPFGKALTLGLKNARLHSDGEAVWEEEDYCNPPLLEEKSKVLNLYFSSIITEKVNKGEGWRKIKTLPKLFPEMN